MLEHSSKIPASEENNKNNNNNNNKNHHYPWTFRTTATGMSSVCSVFAKHSDKTLPTVITE